MAETDKWGDLPVQLLSKDEKAVAALNASIAFNVNKPDITSESVLQMADSFVVWLNNV